MSQLNSSRQVLLTRMDSYFVTVPPASLPVSVELVQEHLRLEGDEATVLYLTLLIEAAASFFEKYTKRTLINTSYETLRSSFFQNFFVLRKSLFQSLVSFTYLVDATHTPVDPAVFYIDKKSDFSDIKVLCNKSFPNTNFTQDSSIRIEFVAGYGPDDTFIPNDIKIALLNLIAELFENRGDCSDCSCEELLPANARLVFDTYRIIDLTTEPYR